jgi:DNA polymerase-3 subunit alpha
MHGVEDLGLLKMDFLGLRNLSVIERTLDLVEAATGARPDIDGVALDDELTFAMLQRGDTIGIFQLEGGPMRNLVRALAPTEFEDVAALMALYRPGPMAANMHNDYADRKNGRKPVAYLHPDMAEVLGDTYGLCVYQEQMMLLAQKFAGYSLAEADNLRKAAGKKVRAIMAQERAKFEAGCDTTGYGQPIGKLLFDIIEPFADYGFNRSHAFGYGFVSYQTAWLKAHYPAEYLAALLTSVKDDKDKTAVYLAECRTRGIDVLVPDVNLSRSEFTAVVREEQGAPRTVIPFGLSAIRNVGEGLVERIIAERVAGGPFSDFYDFCARVDPTVLNKRTVESLVKAGAFDSLGHPRQGLCLVLEQIVDRTLARRREADQGIMSLFDDVGGTAESVFDESRVPIPDQEFDKTLRLAFEKEMLGLYLSDHPLLGVEAALARHVDATIVELRESSRDGEVRWVGGVVTGIVRKYTKRGELMATFTLEDLVSSIEVWVFPRAMTEVAHLLTDDSVICVKGRLDLREEPAKLVCLEIKKPELHPTEQPLHVEMPIHALTDERVESLKRLLGEHPGSQPVLLHVGAKCIQLAGQWSVDTSRGLLAELRVLLGPACLLSR